MLVKYRKTSCGNQCKYTTVCLSIKELLNTTHVSVHVLHVRRRAHWGRNEQKTYFRRKNSNIWGFGRKCFTKHVFEILRTKTSYKFDKHDGVVIETCGLRVKDFWDFGNGSRRICDREIWNFRNINTDYSRVHLCTTPFKIVPRWAFWFLMFGAADVRVM